MNNPDRDSGERFISKLMDTFSRVPSIYEENEAEINRMDSESTDFAHYVEFNAFNAFEGYNLANWYRQNRMNRRILKDQNIALKPVYDFVTRHKNLIPELRKAHTEVAKAMQYLESQQYNSRVKSPEEFKVVSNSKSSGKVMYLTKSIEPSDSAQSV